MFFKLPSLQNRRPRRVLGMSWWSHTIFGYDLITELKPQTFVELGTHSGESYFNFCQAVSEQKLKTNCYAIDTWKGDPHTGTYGEEIFEDVSKYNVENYSQFSQLVRASFDEAVNLFKDGSVDLLHIDGAHDYASVSRDFKTWLPKMSEGGIILFHDIMVMKDGFGVWKLWNEVKTKFRTFEFHHGYGLGVVKVSSSHRFQSEFLNFIFDNDSSQTNSVREYYEKRVKDITLDSANTEANCPEWAKKIKGREENLELYRSVNSKIDQMIYHSGKKTKLDVIIQTHADNNSQAGKLRYCGAEKQEVTIRCLTSLVRSLNSTGPHIDAQLIVIDDHSNPNAISEMRTVLTELKCPHTFISLSNRGIMNSIGACYEWGLNQSREELVYFVQDDYLHSASTIEEMVDAYHRFKSMLGGQEVGIYPYDDPYRYYAPQNVENTRIVHGSKRHWRLNFFSPCMFMTSHQVIRQNYDLLKAMASEEIGPEMEDNTINKIWQKRDVKLFTPIPSLALHLQNETEMDPFIDWRKLWDQMECI